MPTTISALADGFEARPENSAWPGQWLEEGTASTGLTVGGTYIPFPDQILNGFFVGFDWRYKSALKFGPINIGSNQSVNQFDIVLNISAARKRIDFRIKAVLDSTIDLGPSRLPSNQQLTSATVSVSTNTFTDFDPFDYWTITSPIATIDVSPLVQEVIQDSRWNSGNNIWFVLDFFDLGMVPGPNGHLYYYSLDHPTETPAQATYEAGTAPALTSIGGDDTVTVGEQGVQVVGTDLDLVSEIRINDSSFQYLQTIQTQSSNLITFNVSGATSTGSLTFYAYYAGGFVTRALQVETFVAPEPLTITSVSGNNILSTTETNIEILGTGFGTITNLNISKGGISENQTVKSSSSTSIIFDLTLGAIVQDDNYVLSFDSDGNNITTTVSIFVVGGTNITSVGGSNIVKVNQTGVLIAGSGFTGATRIEIFNDDFNRDQTILTNTDTEITFDFSQGSLGYSVEGHTLRLTVSGFVYSQTISIYSEEGSSFSICEGEMLGNNSIGFNADPPFIAGDVLIFPNTSSLGFPLFMSNLWVPFINGTSSAKETFLCRYYDSVTGLDGPATLITFEGDDYFTRNSIPTLSISSPSIIDPVIEVATDSETWEDVNINTSGEIWE